MKKKFVIYIYDSNVYEWQIELYFDFQTEYTGCPKKNDT